MKRLTPEGSHDQIESCTIKGPSNELDQTFRQPSSLSDDAQALGMDDCDHLDRSVSVLDYDNGSR